MISVIDLLKTKDIEKTLLYCQKMDAFLSSQLGCVSADVYKIRNDKKLDAVYDDVTIAPYTVIHICQWETVEEYAQAVNKKEFSHLLKDDFTVKDTGIYHSLIVSGNIQDTQKDHLVIVALFKVPPEKEEAFVKTWTQAKNYMQHCQGFISTHLQKSLNNSNKFTFMHISQWCDKSDFIAAVKTPDFADIHKKIVEYEAHPHFCERIHSVCML